MSNDTPMVVRAHCYNGVMLPAHPIALDGLLAAVVAMVEKRPPILDSKQTLDPLEIPIAKSACGRYHLASSGFFQATLYERKHLNKRPAVEKISALCSPKVKAINTTTGPDKAYHVPATVVHLCGPMVWWAIGCPDRVRDLLGYVDHIGKRRGVGMGRVHAWEVEELELPQWPGFPVLTPDGRPARNLPLDMSGVSPDSAQGFVNLTFPYFMHHQEECYVPDTWHGVTT